MQKVVTAANAVQVICKYRYNRLIPKLQQKRILEVLKIRQKQCSNILISYYKLQI